MSWKAGVVAFLVGTGLLAACSEPQGSKQADTTASVAERIAIGPPLGDADEEDLELNHLPLVGYVYPRNYPNQEVSMADRQAAIAELHAMRDAQGASHFDPDGAAGGCPACLGEPSCLFGECREPCPHESEVTVNCPDGELRYTAPGSSLCFCVLVTAPTDAGGTGGPGAPGCGWTPSGPTNLPGRITSLVFAPDEMTLFAGSVGGLWSSPDKGRRWSRVKVGAAYGTTVGDVAINAGSGEVIVGMFDASKSTYADGIWLSPSGATDTFAQISNASLDDALANTAGGSFGVRRIVSSPAAGGEVYLGSENGVYVGTRSGTTFNWTLLGGKHLAVDDIEIDFSVSPPVVYAVARTSNAVAGADDGVWKYAGGTWSAMNDGITLTGHILRGLIARSGSTSYVRFTNQLDQTSLVFRRQDADPSWTPLPASTVVGGTPTYMFVLEVDPHDPTTVYAGALGLYRSKDSGQTWTDIGSGTDPNFALRIHADQHALAFDSANSKIVYAGTDGGVYMSADTSTDTWHWRTRAHGMSTTQFYNITGQLATASLFAGGSQDNGVEITFGNHSWYQPDICDGVDVGSDAVNSSTLYRGCNDATLRTKLAELTNPVPYTPGGATIANINFPSGMDAFADAAVGKPVVMKTDPTVAGTAIVRGVSSGVQSVLKTTDGVNFSSILALPASQQVTAMAISVGTPKHYYVGTYDTTASAATVYTSRAGDSNFVSASAGSAPISAIAVHPTAPGTAWLATSSNAPLQTSDEGGSFQVLPATDADHDIPSHANLTGIAADATYLYVSTDVGVFRGAIAASLSWEPYDNGLPDGLDVNDIFFNPKKNTLQIGTWGLGGYEWRLDDPVCDNVKLLVRDTVFDHGELPTLSGIPDPEHPIQDPTRPGFYKPNDTDGGKAYFWESTDIRTNVPSEFTTTCGINDADHVEFESCPIEIASCPPDVMTTEDPIRGQGANLFVQVHNRGLGTATGVRVVALYTDASTGVPPLPANFWTQNVVPGGSSCTALDPSGPWHLVGCNTVSEVNARVPEVTKFAWSVPNNAAEHTCMLAIVDSAQDPIVNPTTDVEQMAQNDNHVAHRNMHIIDGPSATPCATNGGGSGGGSTVDPEIAGGSTDPGTPFSGVSTVIVPNRWNPTGGHRVLVSRSGMEPSGRLSFMLPTGAAQNTTGLPPKCGVSATTPGAVAISLPRGLVTSGLALEANYRLELDDRVRVVNAANEPVGQVGNAGSLEVNVGAHAELGSVFSVSNVTLRDSSTIHGNVSYGGTLSQQSNVTVTGTAAHTTTLTPTDLVSWTVQYPATSRGDRTLQPNQHQSEAPGRLGNYTVNQGAVLTLSSGTYYFDSLTFQSGSVLELAQNAGPTMIHTRQGFTFRGTERTASGSGSPDVLLVALGTTADFVETPFIGTIAAPAAQLTLGGGTGRYIGSFYAKELIVRADIVVEQRLSTAWSALPACNALTTQERTKATNAGLAPDLYPLTTPDLVQTWPVPFGGSWTVGLRYESGVGRRGTASRFRIIALQGNTVKGGNTFVLRQ